ncbi:MAG: phage antirepressor KilAC domain-containing protein [Brevibacillus sp.]|nr:phage antirepressor KilAC domain-containing protein [Brevibacillus sp.]
MPERSDSVTQLQSIFHYDGAKLRVVTKNGEPWFVARDVCDILEINNPSQALARLDDDERGLISTDTPGGKQEMAAVNEPGLYSLILGSRKPEAKAFKRWITHEVIPSIRKHGAYMTPETIEKTLSDPDFIIGLASRLKEEKEARMKLEAKVEADRPKVIFAEALEVSETSILVGELAKLLRQNGIQIGQNRLFHWLRTNGYLGNKGDYYNLPTQKAMEMGLFEIKTRTITNPDGSVRTTRTAKVTGKGQIYFINKFMSLQKKPPA